MLFHVTNVFMCRTHTELVMLHFSENNMCILCESIVMYQCTCVFVHDYDI